MAGDWIKIEHGLPGKPEVMRLAGILGIDDMAAVGHLVLFWIWVDQNLSPDCPRAQGTKRGLDRVVGRDRFADAMIQVGWLTFADGWLSIPNYDHHLSESAKKRANESRKKKRQRQRSPEMSPRDGDMQGTWAGTREEKSITDTAGAVVAVAVATPFHDVPTWSVSPVRDEVPSAEIVAAFDEVFGTKSRLTNKRKTFLRARWAEKWWRENWQDALDRASASEFLRGDNERGWTITVDFFLKPDTATHLLEGKYDAREGNGWKKTAAQQRQNGNAHAIAAYYNRLEEAKTSGNRDGTDEALLIEGPDAVY